MIRSFTYTGEGVQGEGRGERELCARERERERERNLSNLEQNIVVVIGGRSDRHATYEETQSTDTSATRACVCV